MDAQTMHGEWWIPGEPDARRHGVLSIGADGELSLELAPGFDLTVKTPLADGSVSVSAGERELPLLHGESEGRLVTLLNCFNMHSRGGFFGAGWPQFQRLYAQRALIGVHLADTMEESFRGATVRLENLTTWLALPAVKRTLGFKNGEASASLKVTEPVEAEVDDWKLKAVASLRGFNFKESRESHTLIGDATAELILTPPAPARLAAFDRVVLEFMDLLTLATGEPCGEISLSLDLLEDDVYELSDGEQRKVPKTAELFGRRVHTADPAAAAAGRNQLRFTCIDMPFAEVVPAWFAVRRRAASACNIFFGMSYARPNFTEIRVLLAAIALETFHRSLYGDAGELSSEHFAALRATLLAALDDGDDKEWVKRKLRNDPSFRERARALAAVPAEAALKLVVPDVEAWAAQLVAARNGLAHTAGEGLDSGIFKLANRTVGVITLVLMTQLGLSDEVQLRASQRSLRVPG